MADDKKHDSWEESGDQLRESKPIYVGSKRNCLAGIAIGLPLSIFLWVGIIYIKYSALKIISQSVTIDVDVYG